MSSGERAKRGLRRVGGFMMKLARVTLYFAFVAAVGVALLARSVYGRAKKLALDLGDDLVALTEVAPDGAPYRLSINGTPVNVATASSPMEMHALLDRFQRACEAHADGLDAAFAHLHEAVQSDSREVNEGYPGVGILRNENDTRGVVVCFAQGKDGANGGNVVTRLADFAKSGDLSRFGYVRYLATKKTASGTHAVAVWTDTPFKLDAMFPEKGDSPGNDTPDAIRPASSRRILTAFAEGAPYTIRVYDVAAPPDAALQEFDRELPKLGWIAQPLRAHDDRKQRVFNREGVDLLVSADLDGASSNVSIIRVGGGGN